VDGKEVVEHYTLPYSQDTLRAWWRVLGLVMRDAMADLDLDRDPMRRVKPPKVNVKPKREQGTLSRDQVQLLLDNAKQYTPTRYAEIATMVLTGMRAGEVYALRFEDIDFEKESINVQRSVWKGEEGTTKTDDPRIVPLHPTLAQVLQEQGLTLNRKKHRGLKSGLVFPSDNGGFRLANSLYDALELAVEAAKIDIHVTPQVLRRTFNTLMMLAGTDRIALRAIMGHTSEEMTQRYSGVGLDVKKAAVRNLFGD
jgi:integrase